MTLALLGIRLCQRIIAVEAEIEVVVCSLTASLRLCNHSLPLFFLTTNILPSVTSELYISNHPLPLLSYSRCRFSRMD